MNYFLSLSAGIALLLNVALSTPAIAVAPTVVTGGVDAQYSSTALELNGTVNPNGVTIDQNGIYFQIGLTTNYSRTGSVYLPSPLNTTIPLGVRQFFSVERGTTYHYRVVAKNADGTSYGEDATFTTALNMPPEALDTDVLVFKSQKVEFFCVFRDPDYETLTVTAVSAPSHGTVTVGDVTPGIGGYFTYTPDGTNALQDEFTYTVTDGYGESDTATVRWANVSKRTAGKYVSTVLVGIAENGLPAGSVGLNVTANRTFTGVVTFFGARYPIHGVFSADGRAVEEIDRIGAPPITVELNLNLLSTTTYLGGVIHASELDYEISGSTRLIFPDNAAEAGSYTMALPPTDASVPLGNGYVTGKVSKHGRVLFTGRIGDGQPFSFGTQLRQGGSAEIYVTAGSQPRDRIYGTLQFPDLGVNESTGNLNWYKAPRSTSYYQEGFQTTVVVQGSRLLLTAKEDKILDYSTELAGLDIVFKDLDDNELLAGSLGGKNETALTFTAPTALRTLSRAPRAKPAVTIHVNRKKGTFSGSVRVPGETGSPRKFSGVLLQHQNAGAGMVRIGNRTGSVTLTPK